MPPYKNRTHFTPFLWVMIFTFQLPFHLQVSRGASVVDTSSFPSTGGIAIPVSDPTDSSSSSAGDLNNDGYEDLLLAMPKADWGTSSTSACGIVYVIFGTASGIPEVDPNEMPASQRVLISGPGEGAQLGYSVSNLGDINGDEVDDIIIGAYGASRAYVIFGSNQLSDIDLATTDISTTNQGIVLSGPTQLGYQVSSAGDFNNDGINDFMVSAPLASLDQSEVYVIFGRSGIALTMDPSSDLTPEDGFKVIRNTDSKFGQSLSVAGDVNNDGITDIMIGSPFCTSTCGVVAIVYGKQSGSYLFGDLIIDSIPLHRGIKIEGSDNAIGTKYSISPAGDINGDGVDDVALGVPNYNNSIGAIYIIFGKDQGFSANIDLSQPFDGFQIKGELQEGWSFGTSVVSADINGDGLSDLLVGCVDGTYQSYDRSGIVYVFFGKSGGFSSAIELANQGEKLPQLLKIAGATEAQIGSVVRCAKDFNQDGINDLIIQGGSETYIVYGSGCESVPQCSSQSLSPICYASGGCVCSIDYNKIFQMTTSTCTGCPTGCATCTSSSACQSCSVGFEMNSDGLTCKESISDEIKTINSITDVTNKVETAGLTTASAIAPHDPGSVTASMLVKMLQYIKYINIPYSERIEQTFKFHNSTYGPFGIGPKIPEKLLVEAPFHPIPDQFLKFHVHSSFLINFWDNFIFITIITGVLLIFVITEYTLTKLKPKSVPLLKIIRVASQNFFLMQFYNVFGDILLFLVLDLRTVTLSNAEESVSLCFAIIFLCIGCIILGIHIFILIKFSTLRRNPTRNSKIEEFSKKFEGADVFFKHFKDNSFISQSFLFIFVMRNLLFNLILALLSDSFVLQANLILTMSVLMLFYLVFKRPFKTIVNLAQHITCEIIFLIINTCVLVMAQLDMTKENSSQTRDRLCEAIIYISLVFSFLPQTFLAIKLAVAAMDWYKKSRKKLKPVKIDRKEDTEPQNNVVVPQFKKFPNNSINESSAEFNILQNSFSLDLNSNNSPIIKSMKPDDSILLKREDLLLDNNIPSISIRGADHNRFQPQSNILENQSSRILEPRIVHYTTKVIDQANVSNNFFVNNRARERWNRKMAKQSSS